MTIALNNLPWPPTVNHYWVYSRGRVRLGNKGRDYRKLVAYSVPPMDTLTKSIEININLFPPDKRKRDVDNVLKALLDALGHANVYGDDSQIEKLSVTRMYQVKDGQVDIIIKER